MVFSCAPNFRAKAAAKKQALKQKLAGAGAYHGVSLRLLLVDKQVDKQGVLPHAALNSVHAVTYDAHSTTLAELVGLIREAHRQNGAPFLSMAIAQHGADSEGQWEWTTDLTVNLKNMHGAIDQLAPVIEVLAAALSKTKAGKAHIDLLACNLATTCKGLVPALEKMYGIDFRASTDETGNDLSGGDWKMETDNDYDVAADYLDAAKLKAYTETMMKPVKGIARVARGFTTKGKAKNKSKDDKKAIAIIRAAKAAFKDQLDAAKTPALMKAALADPMCAKLDGFCASEFNSENLDFLRSANALLLLKGERAFPKIAQTIADRHIKPDSEFQINVSNDLSKAAIAAATAFEAAKSPATRQALVAVLQDCSDAIRKLLDTDVIPRWLKNAGF